MILKACYTRKGVVRLAVLNLYPNGMNIKDPLASFVKQRRRALSLTQPDLANRAGVGLRFIRELEQGKPTLRLDKVNQVLALFGRRMEPVAYRMEEDDATR